jgi:hypothetical protein
MSDVTRLAECTITAFATITIELVEANETPAVVVITWPGKATTLHPRLSPTLPPRSLERSPRPPQNSPASGPGGGCDDHRCRVRAVQAVA